MRELSLAEEGLEVGEEGLEVREWVLEVGLEEGLAVGQEIGQEVLEGTVEVLEGEAEDATGMQDAASWSARAARSLPSLAAADEAAGRALEARALQVARAQTAKRSN